MSNSPRGPAPGETIPRSRWSTLGWILAAGVATAVLLPQAGRLGRSTVVLQDARLPWLAVALAMSIATYAAAALTLMGAAPRGLRFPRTAQVQVATSFANLFLPYGIGAVAVGQRYLERSGISPVTSAATVTLVVSTGFVLHIIELAGVGLWLGSTGSILSTALPGVRLVLIGLGAAAAVLVLIAWVAWRRPELLAEARGALRSMLDILRQPRRAVLLFGGQLGVNIAYISALGCALAAFGQQASPPRLAAAYLAGSALGGAGPTPAGLGVVEASLVAALTVAGVPAGPALAGVLTFRLVTFWLPAAAGFFSFRALRHRRIL
ncbi:lysylphosphatidylglycerol synthase transmembrane domain-containing protein [Nocardia sp. NPDC003345]